MLQKMGIFSSMRKYSYHHWGETIKTKQNTISGIISNLAVGIKKIWTEDSKNDSLFKGYKDQLAVPENCVYIKVPFLYDILKNRTHTLLL